MNKRDRRPSRKGAVLGILLLAVVCVGGAELIASYFFAPAFFAKVTAPVRSAAQAVAGFCSRTADSVAGLADDLSAFFTERFTEDPEPEPSEEPEAIPLAEDAQVADEPLLDYEVVLAALTVTRLRAEEDGKNILTGGIYEITYFNQTEEPWADQPYGSDYIGRYGCGPTAMAIAVTSMTGYETDPAQMSEWAADNGYWASKSGSYLSIVEGTAQAHGLTAESIELTPEAIQSTLLSGKVIVALMGPGHFTKGGHFILLRGITLSGTILVADPASTERSLMEWDAQLIIDELSTSRHDGAPLWALSLNKE